MTGTWADFVNERMPQRMRDHIIATEAAEQRAWEAEQAERADRLDTAARMAEVHEGGVIYRTGHSSVELRQAASNWATARESRDCTAEYGSAARAEVMITGAGGEVVRLQPREVVQRGAWRADPQAELLKRARAAGDNPFMAEEVRRFDQRQRDAGRPVMRRSEASGEPRCIECAAENLGAEESFLLHNDPQFGDPLPETTVPDYAPSRSRRGGRTPMIYR